MTDHDPDIVYARPTLHDASPWVRARHLALVTRLAIRCALKGCEWRQERPTRCVTLSACRICGRYIGSSVVADKEAPCRWFRPSMIREMTPEETVVFDRDHSNPTDPDLCTCGHEGLARSWHMQPCPIKLR